MQNFNFQKLVEQCETVWVFFCVTLQKSFVMMRKHSKDSHLWRRLILCDSAHCVLQSVQKENFISMGYISFSKDIQLQLKPYCMCMFWRQSMFLLSNLRQPLFCSISCSNDISNAVVPLLFKKSKSLYRLVEESKGNQTKIKQQLGYDSTPDSFHRCEEHLFAPSFPLEMILH